MRKALMALDVNERYQTIRDFQTNFNLTPAETSRNLGICYQTVSNANHNLSPTPRVYEHKLKECHKIFIHIKTLFDPHLSGEKLAKMIYDEFGLEVNSRTVNRCRNEMKMQYRPPICSVYISTEASMKRKN